MSEEARHIETGISDDGTSFTIMEDDGSLEGITDPDGTKDDGTKDGVKKDQKTEEEFFDFDKVPEDQREALKDTYGKMETAFKEKTKNFADLQERAGMVDTLVEKLNNLSTVVSSQSQGAKQEQEKVDRKEEKALKFQFEEKDYYKPVFEEIAGLVTNLRTDIAGMKQGFETDKKTSFADGVKTFFADNKVEKEVVVQMDRIAAEMGPGVYKNLPKLVKIAKVDLGLPIGEKTQTVNTSTQKRVGVKRQVESESRKARDIQTKSANTIEEAWNQSEKQLKDQQ